MSDKKEFWLRKFFPHMEELEKLVVSLMVLFGAFMGGQMFGLAGAIIGVLLAVVISVLQRRFFPTIRITYYIFILFCGAIGATIFGLLWGLWAAIFGLIIGGGFMLGAIWAVHGFLRVLVYLFAKPTDPDLPPENEGKPIDGNPKNLRDL